VARTDELGERTELPTPLRLEEARAHGHVPRSGELVTAGASAAALAMLWMLAGPLMGGLTRMTASFLRPAAAPMSEQLAGALGGVLAAAGALALGVIAISAVVNIVQVGMRFVPERVQFDWARVSPRAGVRRMFSLRSLVAAVLAVVKIAAVGAILFAVIWRSLPALASSAGLAPDEIAAGAARLAGKLALYIVAVLVALGAIDWLYQRWQYRQDLRMTRREVRQEQRRQGGDPLLRSRRREAWLSAPAAPRDAVARSSLVVRASQRLAVAVRYVDGMPLPVLATKGSGAAGRKILRQGRECGVPMVTDRRTAAALFKACRVGEEIPTQLYERVAEMLASVETKK